jgi:hypothetical protein
MITAQRNLYTGVNAHLNSLLQRGDTLRWKEFHDYAIPQMATVFNRILIPLGYEAVVQQSVQIRTPLKVMRRFRCDAPAPHQGVFW